MTTRTKTGDTPNRLRYGQALALHYVAQILINVNRGPKRLLAAAMTIALAALLAGCGGSTVSEPAQAADFALTAAEVKLGTIARVESATVVLASDQHVFRFDGESSRTFTKCDSTACGVSPLAAGIEGALQRARSDPRFDFGSHHFAQRLGDSLELKPQSEAIHGVPLVEGFGLRTTGERAFSAKFYGGWLDAGAFFVNRTILTVRDGRGQPIGLGTVFDASALGVASDVTPATAQGMSGTWKGMMVGADVSDNVTRGQFVRGDATLSIDDFANPDVDVAFEHLHDLETGARLDGRHIPAWEDIPLDSGAFGEKPVGGRDYIQGRFVGESHGGAVGVFERSEIVGSFGAARRPGE